MPGHRPPSLKKQSIARPAANRGGRLTPCRPSTHRKWALPGRQPPSSKSQAITRLAANRGGGATAKPAAADTQEVGPCQTGHTILGEISHCQAAINREGGPSPDRPLPMPRRWAIVRMAAALLEEAAYGRLAANREMNNCWDGRRQHPEGRPLTCLAAAILEEVGNCLVGRQQRRRAISRLADANTHEVGPRQDGDRHPRKGGPSSARTTREEADHCPASSRQSLGGGHHQASGHHPQGGGPSPGRPLSAEVGHCLTGRWRRPGGGL